MLQNRESYARLCENPCSVLTNRPYYHTAASASAAFETRKTGFAQKCKKPKGASTNQPTRQRGFALSA
jgi:hypothetical protein